MPTHCKGELSEAARQARNAAQRAWRAKNKDKVKEANRRYWEKKGKARYEALKTGKEAQVDGNTI